MEMVDYFIETVYSPATEFWLDLKKTRISFVLLRIPQVQLERCFQKPEVEMWMKEKHWWVGGSLLRGY